MKVVDNFNNFPESINTLLSDKRFRIMDLWKSGGAAGILAFWTDKRDLTYSALILHPSGNRGNSNTTNIGNFLTFP
jgi:hypothetical protein